MRSRTTLLIASVVLALFATVAAAQTPQGTAFIYQGKLQQSGAPVNANVDMVFELFDAATAGNAVGPALTFSSGNGNPVPVQNGTFSVALDFGPLAFNRLVSDERHLKVTIEGTVLVPRNKIENAPYALQSRTAEVAYTVSGATIGLAQIVPSQVQSRVSGACSVGASIRSIAQNGSVTCQATGGGSVTSIAAGTGLTGGPISTTGTLSIADGGVGLAQIDAAQVQARVVGTCALGEYVRGINADGSVACTIVPGVQRITAAVTAGTVGQFATIAIGADGLPVVAYYDQGGSVRVAHCSNAACTAATSAFVDSAGGSTVALAIGSDGLPILAYWDGVNGDLKVAHCLNNLCGAYQITPVDTVGSVGVYAAIAIGADGLAIVSYYEGFPNLDLKVMHCGNVACTTSNQATALDLPGNVGFDTAIAIGPDGLALVSYYDATNGTLKVAHCNNAACTSALTTPIDVVGNAGGRGTSIAVGADGLAVVSYVDINTGTLKVAHCSNALCSAAVKTTVDPVGFVGAGSSIAIGGDGLPVISYNDGTNGDLKVAHCANPACTGVATLSAVDTAGIVGTTTSIAIGADSLPVISYHDTTNGDLKVVKCNNRFCQ